MIEREPGADPAFSDEAAAEAEQLREDIAETR